LGETDVQLKADSPTSPSQENVVVVEQPKAWLNWNPWGSWGTPEKEDDAIVSVDATKKNIYENEVPWWDRVPEHQLSTIEEEKDSEEWGSTTESSEEVNLNIETSIPKKVDWEKWFADRRAEEIAKKQKFPDSRLAPEKINWNMWWDDVVRGSNPRVPSPMIRTEDDMADNARMI
jgi:hypothetical protein